MPGAGERARACAGYLHACSLPALARRPLSHLWCTVSGVFGRSVPHPDYCRLLTLRRLSLKGWDTLVHSVQVPGERCTPQARCWQPSSRVAIGRGSGKSARFHVFASCCALSAQGFSA